MAFAFVAAPDRRVVGAVREPPLQLFDEHDYARQRAFFASRPELRPTPLRRFPSLARTLALGEIRAKDETHRFGLNAFKAAGAMFAIATLRERGDLKPGEMLVCASEGNHGRAVARAARDVGCRARVYLAASVAPARIRAIESEGAAVVTVPGTYDAAVRVMADDARQHGWRVISDTSLEGEPDEVPRLIMLGYTRLMDEAEAEWQPGPPPDAIFVPGGVGGLLAAVADWACRADRLRQGFGESAAASAKAEARGWTQASEGGSRDRAHRTAVVCVEPTSAACLQASAREGRPTRLAGPFDTVMAGLRCGEVSRAGFQTVRGAVDAYVAIDDRWALDAMRQLASGKGADPVVEAGASGAAALGGLLATLRDPGLMELKDALGLGPDSRVMVFVSEGVTDPELFAQAVGRPANEHPYAKMREPK